MSEMVPISSATSMVGPVGNVRSSSPLGQHNNNTAGSPTQRPQQPSKENTIELNELNENTWFSIGNLSNSMDEWDKAIVAYESALRHNPTSTKTLHALGRLLLERDQFGPAVEVFQRLITLMGKDENRGEILAEIALCWMGMEDLSKAAAFIQKAVEIGKEFSGDEEVKSEDGTITNIPTMGNYCPTLWYALGIYHDRLGNEEAALDAYLAFIESERAEGIEASEISDRSREVYYRLGVIYRLIGKFKEARECLDFVRRQLTICVRPSPSAQNQIYGPCHVEVLMQLALIDEAEGAVKKARFTLEKLLVEVTTPGPMNSLFRIRNLIPKLRQKLGCLALSQSTVFENDSSALALLLKATEEDPQDALNWYFLGRLYLQLRQPTKAYDAYQQAVYRDGRNAAFWNSIGLLYFNIGQFRDALDAFTRAVNHAPHAIILWWNLGLLYESCHGVGSEDAREAFRKGVEYARAKNDQGMLSKLEGKLAEDTHTSTETQRPTAVVMEMDANRFVTRLMAAFPRPQSAASMSRFLTYRGQQAAQASQMRRPTLPPQQAPQYPYAGAPQGMRQIPLAAGGPGAYPPQMRPPTGSGVVGAPMRPIYGTNPHGSHPHYR